MNNKICKIHNEPAIFVDEDDQQNQVSLCSICVQQRLKIKHIDDVEKEEKYALKQLKITFDESIELLNSFAVNLEQFNQQIQWKLNKFKQQVEQNTSHLISKKNEVKNMSNGFKNLQLNQTNQQKKIINNQLGQIMLQLNNTLKELEISTNLNSLYQLLNNQTMEERSQLQQQDDAKKIQKIDKNINNRLIHLSSYQQNEWCQAIAFNKDNSIMIAGCEQLIKVFEFDNQKLSEVQQLNGHSHNVLCLQFMKKQNQFISGSQDNTMIIWGLNKKNKWEFNQVMKSHTYHIVCITMNQNEELLISGSEDKTIKFWQKQNNIWSCNKQTDCQSEVYSISLNNQGDNLIASVFDNQILVIQLQGYEWMIKQKIQVEQYGFRLSFIDKNKFVFQPYCGQYLQIFDFDVKDQTYKKGRELQYQDKETGDDCFFPIQCLTQIGLVIVKNGHHVYLIQRNQNGQFTIEQSINLNNHYVYGCMSDNGRYIALWSQQNKEIQIRKFEL